ncbi:MAG: Flp family type IVb pilin [Acidobacteria bacterium]|nr:MAG: Flp family type IVb pilin [Acidobacteriota bacterium]
MLLALLQLRGLLTEEEGQDLVEYALLLVFLALAAIVTLPILGSAINVVFSESHWFLIFNLKVAHS